MIFYAHSGNEPSGKDWQTLKSHLLNVGDMAAEFARFFGAEEMARYTGYLHDLGKYSAEFDARLHGSPKRVDHSTAGAKVAVEHWGLIGKLLAFCIAGHHAGLANGIGENRGRQTLKQRLDMQFGQEIPPLNQVWRQEINLPEKLPAPSSLQSDAHHPDFSYAFFTRMLYSCLVDADFLDTEAFYRQLDGKRVVRGNYPDLGELHCQFNRFISHLGERVADMPQTNEVEKRHAGLNCLRGRILRDVVAKAVEDKGLFTLTVPTGGGKTFTSMAFALEHALRHGMRRVIYVIPFTSIIEQNAKEFRQAFGELGDAAVLEHHSNFDDGQFKEQDSADKLRLAAENWDMPVVVTTAVQFFESLFADRSSRCRKLHNISGSVIILDEAQMLPLKFLLPIMQAIKELANNYHCSVVMCTATQPAVQAENGFYRGFENVRELASEPSELFRKLRRTTVQHIGVQTDADLLEKFEQNPQLLVVVNNRRHARSLYEQTKHLDGVFHLSTLMCAAHRRKILAQIHQALEKGESCRLISTSLIECGVNIDMPLVMRAEAGLDSIAQAGGRCNREGKRLPENSFIWVFRPEEQWQAPPELSLPIAAMRSVLRRHTGDLLSTEAMDDYFSNLYDGKGKDLDGKNILNTHYINGKGFDFPFQTIAEQFRMIENHMVPLLIPYDAQAATWIERLHYADKVGGILRKLQNYTVQIPERSLDALLAAGRVEPINAETFGRQFYALIGLDLYDDVAGLDWQDTRFWKLEQTVF